MHITDQDRTGQLATQVRRLRWMNYGMAAVIAAGVLLAAASTTTQQQPAQEKFIQISTVFNPSTTGQGWVQIYALTDRGQIWWNNRGNWTRIAEP